MRNWLIGIAWLGVVSVAAAHHNTGAYFDTETEFTIEGVVGEVHWRNPHVYFTITETSDNGEENTWRIEAGPTGIMRRLGWTRDTLKSGDAVTVVTNPSRRADRKSGFLVSITAPGKTYPPLRGEPAFTTLIEGGDNRAAASDIGGVWVTLLNKDYYDRMEDTDSLPLTEKGRASLESYDETRDAPFLDCIPYVTPIAMTIPDIKLVTVESDRIRIRGEFHNEERVIYLDPEQAPTEATVQGRSIGRWDDGVLVIESDLFAAHRTGNVFGVESSPQKRVTETVSLGDDGTTLNYSFTLEDPQILSEPISADIVWNFRPDLDYESLPCDLENSRQYLHD